MSDAPFLPNEQWWLAEIDQYGNPKLSDGAHSNREGVEKALYLHRSLGLEKDKRYACAQVILTECEPVSHGANEDAIRTLNSIGLKP